MTSRSPVPFPALRPLALGLFILSLAQVPVQAASLLDTYPGYTPYRSPLYTPPATNPPAPSALPTTVQPAAMPDLSTAPAAADTGLFPPRPAGQTPPPAAAQPPFPSTPAPARQAAATSPSLGADAVYRHPSASQPYGQRKPLWELGIAIGGGYVPDYPAAAQNHFKAIALPYVIYRGDFLSAGEGAILKGRIVRTSRFEFDVSLDGSFAADSNSNDLRKGMNDLDYLGEIGPRLQILIGKSVDGQKVELELPVRAVFSTDLSGIDYRGLVFHPELAYQNPDFINWGIKFKLSGGPIFASEKLQDYFYEVPAAFATATRPQYDAAAGYLGSTVSAKAVMPVSQSVNLFALGEIGLYTGAENADSPLHGEDVNVSLGIGITWSFYQSKRMVNR